MKRFLRVFIVLAIVGVAFVPSLAFAQSTSPSYGVDEVFFGSGGELEACGDEYCSKQSAGELTVGSTSSDRYEAQAGFNTTDQPLLEVAVNGSVDFGELSVNDISDGSATFQVRTYLARGYTVYLVGSAPKIANHTLAGMGNATTAAFPVAGTEQFGISLMDTAPVQVPDSGFSFGRAMLPYDEPAAYAWVDAADETRAIAESDKSSGQTNYTISMVANMSNITPAGHYTTSLAVVAVPVF